MCRILHLSTLNCIKFLFDHLLNQSKFLCISNIPLLLSTFPQSLASSANFKILFVRSSSMSFKKTVNKRGYKMDPCGTPLATSAQSEQDPFTLVKERNTPVSQQQFRNGSFSIHQFLL